jgi:hypothetical protein
MSTICLCGSNFQTVPLPTVCENEKKKVALQGDFLFCGLLSMLLLCVNATPPTWH